MSYVFMAYHSPKPEHRQDLLKGIEEMRNSTAKHPGFIDAGPWEEVGTERIVGISIWESREAFLAATPPGFGEQNDTVHEWENQPRQRIHLQRWEPNRAED